MILKELQNNKVEMALKFSKCYTLIQNWMTSVSVTVIIVPKKYKYKLNINIIQNMIDSSNPTK